MFLVSVASPDKDTYWNEKGINGSLRFVKKVFDFVNENKFENKSDRLVESKVNESVKEISEKLEGLGYNIVVIKLRELFDYFERGVCKKDFEKFLKMFSVFCPHVGEELWEKLGNKKFIALEKWPVFDEKKIDEKLGEAEGKIEKLGGDINNIVKILKDKNQEVAKAVVYTIPPEKNVYDSGKSVIEKKTGLSVEVWAVNDSDKYDPENKAKSAKHGKPAIYLE